MLKKVIVAVLLVIVNLVALAVTVIGPWPAYSASDVSSASYFQHAVAAIDADFDPAAVSTPPTRLQAGWASRSITPPVGTPLAGFGDRKGKPSTGVHDELHVKALALSDGADTVVLVGSDMLIMPENVTDLIRQRVSGETSLTSDSILFNASHSHSGPGAFAPGVVSKMFSGEYDPAVPELLVNAFSEAIVEASNALEPAAWADGSADASAFIRNRTRDAGTDGELSYLVVRQEDGDRCFVVSFSAHPTILGGKNMEFSGDYPGCIQRKLEEEDDTFAMFLSGAVGSMSVRAEGPDMYARAEAFGGDLARLVLEDARDVQFETEAQIAGMGAGYKLPPMQLRINQSWRFSPFLISILGIDNDGWIQGIRIGDLFLFGTPADFSGEISHDLKQWADTQDIDLWVCSFNGDYAGYVSPDRYYTLPITEDTSYEMQVMSWCGPNQEAFFTGLLKHMTGAMMVD
jgi:Neutral/alkaline non-lysosomal ceramidase, N-terminal